MGVLPLEFKNGASADSLGLTGTEEFTVAGLDDHMTPGQDLEVTATNDAGQTTTFTTTLRIDTPVELEYYRHGGILHMVLRNMSAR